MKKWMDFLFSGARFMVPLWRALLNAGHSASVEKNKYVKVRACVWAKQSALLCERWGLILLHAHRDGI